MWMMVLMMGAGVGEKHRKGREGRGQRGEG